MLRLQQWSLDWALEHALQHGDTDLFPRCFEFEAIKHDWLSMRAFLEDVDLDTWQIRPHRQCLAPKGRYSFRIATQLDPLDFLLFTAAVCEIGQTVEAARVPPDQQVVFSYRFAPQPDGRMFDPNVGYGEFVQRTRDLAGESGVTHVAVTDIADFYPRVYHHPLENALASAGVGADHTRCIMKLLSGWSSYVSHGLPVGNAASRLLAEIDIAGIDEGLLAAGVRFARYNDDYRIFAGSFSKAYRDLAALANQLYEVHGLTLQPKKTWVMPVEEFEARYRTGPEDREIDGLHARFHEILAEIGVEDEYAELDYTDLDPEHQALVDGLNLKALFDEEASTEEPDLAILRFALRRTGQLGSSDLVNSILNHIEVIHPVFPDVVRYLGQLRHLDPAERARIGGQWLDLLGDSVLTELEYHRAWALNVFASGTDWANHGRLVPLLGILPDSYSRREILMALGRAGAAHWFYANRRNLFNEAPWVRRAFLAGASCLPKDQRHHWYRSVASRLDRLESAVVEWAGASPVGGLDSA